MWVLCNTNKLQCMFIVMKETVTECNSVTHCVFWATMEMYSTKKTKLHHPSSTLTFQFTVGFGYVYVDLFTIREINKITKWDRRGGEDYKHLFLFYLIFHASGQEHSRRHFLRFLRGRFVTLEHSFFFYFFFFMQITTSARLVCSVQLCEQTQ